MWYKPPTDEEEEKISVISTISHAIKNISETPIETSLRKLLPSLTTDHVIQLIQQNPLSLPASSILSFFHCLPSASSSSSSHGFRHTVSSYCAMAHLLFKHRMRQHSHSLLRLLVTRKGRHSAPSLASSLLQTTTIPTHLAFMLNSLMDAYTLSGFISDSIQCFRFSKSHRLLHHIPSSFNSSCSRLLRLLLRSHPTSSAWAFYLEIMDSGFPPHLPTFNILIHSFCKRRMITAAHAVFAEMERRGLPPTVVTYNTLIHGHCVSGHLNEAFRLKSVMPRPDVVTYTILIHTLCSESRLAEGKGLFEEMCAEGIVPTGVCFSAMINGHCSNGDADGAMEVYRRMVDAGVNTDVVTVNTVVKCLCRKGEAREGEKVCRGMYRSMGLKPDRITYTTLIDGFCKEGDLESAMETRRRMGEEGIEGDVVTMTAMVVGLCRGGRVEEGERVVGEMEGAGMKVDDATCTMVVNSWCRGGGVGRGMGFVRRMLRGGRIPNVATFNALMNGMCRGGRMREARGVLDEMIRLGVKPDDITFNTLLEGHRRFGQQQKQGNDRGVEQVMLQQEKGLVPDYAVYCRLVE